MYTNGTISSRFSIIFSATYPDGRVDPATITISGENWWHLSDEQEYASATKTTSKIWAPSFLKQLDFQQGMRQANTIFCISDDIAETPFMHLILC